MNIVATASLISEDHHGYRLDLRKIAQWCRNVEYNPGRFNACVMRIREPKACGLIFATGKIVITGARSIEFSKTAGKLIEKAIIKVIENNRKEEEKPNHLIKLHLYRVVNIVAQSDVGFSIKLESLLAAHKTSSDCHYEPELFPGLVYRVETPKVALIIFASGKIVMAGAKSREDLNNVYEKFYPVLFGFKKTNPSRTAGSKMLTHAETQKELMKIK